MKAHESWRYNEYRQVGKDYSRQEEVDLYDSSHADFRNIEEENHAILNLLDLQHGQTLIDFGSGTGTFAILAAGHCDRVIAVDVSPAMLRMAKTKASRAGVLNVEFHHGGFLSYDHKGAKADSIVSNLSFHHLPDFWKGIALKRICGMLKPGGKFYLNDVILEEEHALENISDFIAAQHEAGGEFLREDAEEHFREEYSTYGWVMDGLLSRAGFVIQNREMYGKVFGRYLCIKEGMRG